MSRDFSHTMSVMLQDTDVEIEFVFTKSAYIPEQGPSYASGGQPAEGGEVEITSATAIIGMDRKRFDVPTWLVNIFAADDSVIEELSSSVSDDDEGPDPDAAYEQMRDERDNG